MKTLYKFGLIVAFVGNAHAATVAPKITKISVTPTSATAGTMFKFTAELDSVLPTGYKLKIDTLGKKSFAAMTGSNTNYSLSRAVYTVGTLKYKVVIVNAKNVVQGVAKVGSYSVTSAMPENHVPTLSLIKTDISATTNTVYTVTLNAKDIDANLNSITMNWGDNSEPETLTATDSNDLVFSHTYTSASSFGWNAFASDNGTPALNSKSISKIVTVSAPVVEVIAPPAKTTGYTKIANDGSELPDSATLGANPTDWACTKDNKTGLIWEVKTDDGGLHDKDWTYSWYEPDANKNGGYAGVKTGGFCVGSACNTDDFKNVVNQQKFCGSASWRMPSNEELKSLVYCSDSNYYSPSKEVWGYICKNNEFSVKTQSPTIETAYFPNTMNWYWSSSYAYNSNGAWVIYFNNGLKDVDGKEVTGNTVRLVHNPQI